MYNVRPAVDNRKQLIINLSEDEHAKLREYATSRGITMRHLLTRSLDHFFRLTQAEQVRVLHAIKEKKDNKHG